jgi:hypothetical protein
MVAVHFSKVRQNAFGGQTFGTLCNRLRTLRDGMNCTENKKEVTCKLCLKRLTTQGNRP